MEINNVSDLINAIKDNTDDEHTIFYRGHADKNYQIKPSIYRQPIWISNEHNFVREIQMKCPEEFEHKTSSFEKLVKMQHYNLPTRLLDITHNPLVALFFACINNNNDGQLLSFKIPKKEIKYFDSDTVSVVSNVAWLDSNFDILANETSQSRFEKNAYQLKLLQAIQQEKPYFLSRIEPKDVQSVICVKPKLNNQRIIRQDGAFLLFGIKNNKHQPAELNPEWLSKDLIIKAEAKKTILSELGSLGISEAKLFPEIDTVAKFIKESNEFQFSKFESIQPKPLSKKIQFT